jgi:hypothetical protein
VNHPNTVHYRPQVKCFVSNTQSGPCNLINLKMQLFPVCVTCRDVFSFQTEDLKIYMGSVVLFLCWNFVTTV